MRLPDPRGKTRVAHLPAATDLTFIVGYRDYVVGPGIGGGVALFAPPLRVPRARFGVMPVVALLFDKTAARKQTAQFVRAVHLQARQSVDVRHHVRLADQHQLASGRAQVVAEGVLGDRQRHAVPRCAVARHISPGIKTHARGAAHARLRESTLEQRSTRSQRVQVRRGEPRMTVTGEVISAQLITHDEEQVADRHRSGARWFGQSALKPEAWITGPQRAASAAMMRANSSAVVPVGSSPRLESRSRTSGIARVLTIAALRRSTIGFGVPVGA